MYPSLLSRESFEWNDGELNYIPGIFWIVTLGPLWNKI